MTGKPSIPFESWLHRARQGDPDSVSQLLEAYRNYLLLLARMQLGKTLQARVSASDVAQESILVAERAFDGFRGTTESELLAWLRRVLANRIVDVLRHHSAKARDYRLDLRLDDALDRSSCDMRDFLPGDVSTPSQVALKREREVILADALARLPKDYCDVIVMRHLESRSFPDVAERMGRTVASVKSIWTRAMTRLRDELGGDAL